MSSDQTKQSALDQIASQYVVRLYSGELTAKEEREILTWCAADEANQQAFDQSLMLWESSSQLIISIGWRDKLERRFHRYRYVAASLLVALIALGIFLTGNDTFDHHQSLSPQLYVTAVGEVSQVGLQDGSKVTLNTASKIKVVFNNDERELWLTQGEAFFDIASDPNRPFLIHMKNKTVRVVGTKFNIKLSTSGFDIAVAEGVVKIEENTSQMNSPVVIKPVVLKAGTMASFSNTSTLISNHNAETVNRAQSWRSGYLRFDDERLEKVIDSFNRYRNVKIVIDDAAADLRISGVFKLSDGDAILTALEATLPIDVRKDKEIITIVKK